MKQKNRKRAGGKLANFLIGVLIAVAAFGIALLVYFSYTSGLTASLFRRQPALTSSCRKMRI